MQKLLQKAHGLGQTTRLRPQYFPCQQPLHQTQGWLQVSHQSTERLQPESPKRHDNGPLLNDLFRESSLNAVRYSSD